MVTHKTRNVMFFFNINIYNIAFREFKVPTQSLIHILKTGDPSRSNNNLCGVITRLIFKITRKSHCGDCFQCWETASIGLLFLIVHVNVSEWVLQVIFMRVSAWQQGAQFHIKQTDVTAVKGGYSVIYKDLESTLSTKNERHSSIWQDKRELVLPFRPVQKEFWQEREMSVSYETLGTSTSSNKQVLVLPSRRKSNILPLQNLHYVFVFISSQEDYIWDKK